MGSPCANPKGTQAIHFAIQFIPQKSTLVSFFYKHELNIHRILISFSMSWAFFSSFWTTAYNLVCSLQKNTHTDIHSSEKGAMNLLFDLLKTGFRLTALTYTHPCGSVYSLIWHSESSETSFIVNVSSKGTLPPHHNHTATELSDPFAYYYISLVGANKLFGIPKLICHLCLFLLNTSFTQSIIPWSFPTL